MVKPKSGVVIRRNYLVHRNIDLHRVSYLSPYREKEIPPGVEDLERIKAYIKNPTNTGIWKLGINWDEQGEIVKEIYKILETVSKDRYISRRPGFDRFRRLSRESLIFIFFKFLIEGNKNEREWRQTYYDYEVHRIFSSLSETKNRKTLQTFKDKYIDSIKFFKNSLYKKGLATNLISDHALSVKGGVYFLEEDEEEDKCLISKIPYDCVLVSTNKEPLEKISTFFNLIKLAVSTKLMRVFSPEDEVFSSYIGLLRYSYKYLFLDKSVSSVIEKTISEYEEDNYDHSVGIIGLGTEEMLVEIYENYFRDSAPKKYTLKQLYRLIHDSIRKSLHPNVTSPDPTNIYVSIKDVTNKGEGNIRKKDILTIIRRVLDISNENRKYFETKIKNLKELEIHDSVFPKPIRDNIEELIDNRNKVSHKSRVSAGSYDVLRTLYCYITLVIWWDEDKDRIDGNQSQDEILKESVERNSSQTPDIPELQD